MAAARIHNMKKSQKTIKPNSNLTDDLPLSAEYLAPVDEISTAGVDIDVVPPQEDEFTCSQCFLVRHKSQLGKMDGKLSVCKDCI
ncbi:MAG: DUF4193 domain-containing protein [Bifidobacteriaceae bacterium]|jgi:hypothetical protein|nr:DUF4193 domain-containing protein [Bifidobacteriaceae bacterium]